MSPPRVLFLHGLEGRPDGAKARAMEAAGLEVHAADMHMSRWALGKRNSFARQLLRMPEPWLTVGGGLAGLAWSAQRRSVLGAVASIAASGGWLALRRDVLLGAAIARSLDACVAIQREAIETFRPHVVVGSSWGGAVAAELLLEGAWRGPTLLLAPAFAKVRRATGRPVGEAEAELRRIAERTPIAIVHDPSDAVIAHQDSLRLSAGSRIALRSVDGGGHRLLGFVDRGELATEARRLGAPSSP